MIWVMLWKISGIYVFFFSTQTIKGNCYIVSFIFLPIIFSDGTFISSQLYLFINGLISDILCNAFLISACFNAIFTRYWRHFCYLFYWWCLFLPLYCLSNKENLYMIHHDSNLFYHIYNTINEHNQR